MRKEKSADLRFFPPSLAPTPLPLTLSAPGMLYVVSHEHRTPLKGGPSLSQAPVLYLGPILANGASSGAKGKQGAQKSAAKLPFGVRIYFVYFF